MGRLGIEQKDKGLLSNSATSRHVVRRNSVVQDIEEWRTQFFHVKYILASGFYNSGTPQIVPIFFLGCSCALEKQQQHLIK